MNKQLLSIFLLSMTLTSFGQQDVDKNPPRKSKIGIYGALEYGNVRLLTKKGFESYNDFVQNSQKYYSPSVGYTVGATYIYSFSEKFELGTGLTLNSWKHDFNKNKSIPELGNFNSRITNYYIDLPVKASLILGDQKLKFILSGEVAFVVNAFYKEKLSNEIQTEYLLPNSGIQLYPNPGFGLQTGISTGVSYDINSNWIVRVEPHFKYIWLKYTATSVSRFTTWSTGLNCTLLRVI